MAVRIIENIISWLLAWVTIWFIVALIANSLVSDSATQLAGPLVDKETRDSLAKEHGTESAIVHRAIRHTLRMVMGQYGRSWRTHLPVIDVLLPAAYITSTIAVLSTGVTLAATLCLAALRPNTGRMFVLAFSAVPSFVLTLWILRSGVPGLLGLPYRGFLITETPFTSLFIPSFCIGIGNLGFVAPRVMAVTRLVQSKAWFKNSIALGVSPNRALFYHGWPYYVSTFGDTCAQAAVSGFTGAVAVEYVCSIPGLGTLLVDAIQTGDIPVVMGTVAATSYFVLAVMLIRSMLFQFLPSFLRDPNAA